MKKSTLLSSLIYILCTLCLSATLETFSLAATPARSPQYGGTLRMGDLRDSVSLGYPPKMTVVVGQKQAAPAVETLYRTDSTGKPIPWLATGETNNVAAKTITITLRKNVKFHDGTDFNAEAVKWNLEQCMSARLGGSEKFKSIDIVNDYTVRINLTEWDNTVTSNLGQTLGAIVSPTACKKNGNDWCGTNPVGTGPFQFVSWDKDNRTVYKKFNGYWQKGKPYLDRIEYIPIVDPLTRQMSFRKGELDLALTLAQADLAKLEKDGYTVIRRRIGAGSRSLVPDSINPKSPFANVKVRQATKYAIDTQAIVKTVLFGEAEAPNQWIYKGHWGYNPAVVGYPYNPAKAKQLLAEAGYPNGFKTKITFVTSGDASDLVFTSVQGYLKDVGIDAELEAILAPKWFQLTQGGSWEGLIQGGPLGNPDAAAVLASRYIGGKYYTQMLVPDDYLKAVTNALAAPDFVKKQQYTREAMKLMIDKYAMLIPLYCGSDFVVSQKNVHNHGIFATPNTAIWTPEDAWLD